MTRADGRGERELRPLRLTKDFMKNAHGSVLIEWGNTRLLCTAMATPGVPPFLEGTDKGWLTAEYAMLPASTPQRKVRENKRPDGRNTEISRIIGRCLRSVTDMNALTGLTVYIDCDVIEADGGTRTAAITGGYVALELCAQKLLDDGLIVRPPLRDGVAAVSCGIVDGTPVLDLDYPEDSRAVADMNVAMSHSGGVIEVLCTGEKRPVKPRELQTLLRYAQEGIGQIAEIQRKALEQKNE
jgi:ribonuclease PH